MRADGVGQDGRVPSAPHRRRFKAARSRRRDEAARDARAARGPGIGADARAGGADCARVHEAHFPRPGVAEQLVRLRLRRRQRRPAARENGPRRRDIGRDAGQAAGLFGPRPRLVERGPLPRPRRGGPHVGHGLRAAAAQDRFPNPAGPADFDVVRDVAQGGAADGQRLSQGLLPGQRRVFRTLREQGHYAARRGRRRLRQVQAHDCVLKGARRGKDDRLRGDEARVRPAHAVSADGRLSCQVHPRRQGPGRARLGPQRVPRGQVPAPRRHGRGRARLGHPKRRNRHQLQLPVDDRGLRAPHRAHG
mmetsp:Transcript_29728/g.102396  ORF Transcript_29728/g.102396 Transcript_29728/m.102396 type:complete len:306 (+) Transcript_29728:593-1510(+)